MNKVLFFMFLCVLHVLKALGIGTTCSIEIDKPKEGRAKRARQPRGMRVMGVYTGKEHRLLCDPGCILRSTPRWKCTGHRCDGNKQTFVVVAVVVVYS